MRLKCASAIAGVLPERERRRRKHQQRRSATLLRHACDTRRLEAAVGPDAVDQRQPAADLVLRDVEHALLLVEGAGGDLGRMRIDGDGRQPFDRGDVAQMLAEVRFVDRQIVLERQQHRRNDAVRDYMFCAVASPLSCFGPPFSAVANRSRAPAGARSWNQARYFVIFARCAADA